MGLKATMNIMIRTIVNLMDEKEEKKK